MRPKHLFLIFGLVAAGVLLACAETRHAMAQVLPGDDGDCDDLVAGAEGVTIDTLLQAGCVRNQVNNLTVIYQSEVIRNVVGARLLQAPGPCVSGEERAGCAEVRGMRITAAADDVQPAARKWNAWIDGKGTRIEPGKNDLMPTEGNLWNGTAGLDYRFNDRLVAGIVTSLESSNLDTGGLFTGSTEAQGLGAGLSAGATLADNLILNAMVLGSIIDTGSSFSAIASNMDSRRVQASAGLTDYIYFGQTRYTPSVTVSWSKEFQDSFIDSAAFFNPQQTIESAVATFGGTLGHTISLDNGQSIEPWAAAYFDWTMYSEVHTDGVGTTDLGEMGDIRLQAGFNWTIQANMQLNVTGEIGGLLMRDQDTYAGEANLAIQF